MTQNKNKKALYEVIGKGRLNVPAQKYEKVYSQPESDEKPLPVSQSQATKKYRTSWTVNPRTMQFINGKIEISLPYQVYIVFLLVLILAGIIAFRMGQLSQIAKKQTSTAVQAPEVETLPENSANIGALSSEITNDQTGKLKSANTGNNRIVIQTTSNRRDLEPVKQFFAEKNIETEIKFINNTHFLVTKKKFNNPKRPGTDGNEALNEIIRIGAEYKAPEGYGNFGPLPFHDAYGMKFDD